jgi:nitrogen-specific signal transduction histidine kinase
LIYDLNEFSFKDKRLVCLDPSLPNLSTDPDQTLRIEIFRNRALQTNHGKDLCTIILMVGRPDKRKQASIFANPESNKNPEKKG